MTTAEQPHVTQVVVNRIALDYSATPAVILEGTGTVALPFSLRLHGARALREATIVALGDTTARAGSRWSARFDLLGTTWTGTALAPRSGRYWLRACAGDGSALGLGVTAELPAGQLIEQVAHVRFELVQGELNLVFGPPLTDRERGARQQQSLESDYRSLVPAIQNAVFFESFFGQNASCNPLAIDRALARIRPDIARYWSVVDASVAVPAGAIRLIEGSADWWQLRAGARLLVVNDWLRSRFVQRPHQTVLQTWHGTMLKRLALNRKRLGLRAIVATLRESSRWSILLAQNAYSARIFRGAYGFLGPIWQEGYPRNDVLRATEPGVTDLGATDFVATELRSRLGISADATVVLYAPTWRDDRPDHIDHLDVAAFTKALGADVITLIRGHSRTLTPGHEVHAANVIDVTAYPDVSELYLVADVLITDYSSVMFDFSVTGKPIFFYTPDLEHYREKLRGFYFDLIEVAPGPVVAVLSELVDLVIDRAAVAVRFTERYAAWQHRFNPRDDGGAADRVVHRLLAEGKIG